MAVVTRDSRRDDPCYRRGRADLDVTGDSLTAYSVWIRDIHLADIFAVGERGKVNGNGESLSRIRLTEGDIGICYKRHGGFRSRFARLPFRNGFQFRPKEAPVDFLHAFAAEREA